MKKYFRRITALFPKRLQKLPGNRHFAYQLRSFLFFFLVILAGVLLQILVTLSDKYKAVRESHERVVKEYTYWKSVSAQYPAIPDILYNAAVSSFNAGELDEARKYAAQAVKIDPLFEKAQKLREDLGD